MDFSSQLDGLQHQVAEARTGEQVVDKRSRQIDADMAATDADMAEADATAAIDYAAWTIDNACLAVLDAIDVRAYVNMRASTAAS